MLVEFSIVPVGKGEHLGDPIAEVVKLVGESGLDYRLHAMGTNVEGSWDEIMELVKRCHEAAAKHSPRVYTKITIDDFQGRTGALTSKVEDMAKRLGGKVKT